VISDLSDYDTLSYKNTLEHKYFTQSEPQSVIVIINKYLKIAQFVAQLND